MGAEELKEALKDCVINFDTQVLVTDLLQDYQMAYADVDKILAEHVAKMEKMGNKFDKRFLISGEEETTNNEIYKIVNGENKVKEWLSKLKNAESALYAVKISGGAKPAADMFVPMRWCPIQVKNIETRPPLKYAGATAASSNNTNVKTEVKNEPKKPKGFDFAANTKKPATTEASKAVKSTEKDIKKSPTSTVEKEKTPKKQISPVEEKQAANTKGNAKKGIASFFGAAKTDDKTKKSTSQVVKPPTPKKMQDFFKKTDKTAPQTKANESIQLFADDDDEDEGDHEMAEDKMSAEAAVSSDDEAELEALREKCKEASDADDEPTTSKNKRRRIIDSDDDDDGNGEPQVKHEKKEDTDEPTEAAAQSETFLDEDGFVITVKAKRPAVGATKKPVKVASPEKKSPTKAESKNPTKSTPKAAAKTKQGKIMNFFTKK